MSNPETNRSASDASTTNCYCELWTTNPDCLQAQGIPEGFCGICQTCGCPGHTRHFPGPVPYTGSWCDTCYRNLAWRRVFRSPASWFMLLVFGISAFSIYHFIKQVVD